MARDQLHQLLKEIVGNGGHVYFQPPSSVTMEFPCILYKRDTVKITHADNVPYRNRTRYVVTVIDPDPDSEIHTKVAEIPTSKYSRFFTKDNLNHDVYTLFF